MTIEACEGSRGELTPEVPDRTVGIAGFGLLGASLAHRLVQAGYRVLAHDPAQERRSRIPALGAQASRLPDLADRAGCVVVAVYDAAQVADVIAALARPAARPLVLCATTLLPREAVQLEQLARRSGLRFIEMPVSGSSREVEQGRALALLGDDGRGGLPDGLVQAMCPQVLRVPGAGSPAALKLAINLVLEVNRAALAEGFVFAERAGLDLDLVEQALLRSAAASRVMEYKAPKMRLGLFEPEGRLEQSLKDVRGMLAQAGAPDALPLTAAVCGLLAHSVEMGEGALDSAAIIRALRRRACQEAPC